MFFSTKETTEFGMIQPVLEVYDIIIILCHIMTT